MENDQNKPLIQNPTPVEQNVSTPPPSPEKINPKTKLFIIISAIIIGALILLTVGFFALNSYIRSEELKPNESNTKLETPSPTPDPTADWKTFSTSKYGGLSFKFPNGWVPPEDLDSVKLAHSENWIYTFNSSQKNVANLSVEQNLKFYPDSQTFYRLKEEESISGKYKDFENRKEDLLINGIKVLIYELHSKCEVGSQLEKSPPSKAVFYKDGFIFTFVIGYPLCENDSISVLKQILSTFKFTDQNSNSACVPEPSICKNQLVGAYPKECVEPPEGWCP